MKYDIENENDKAFNNNTRKNSESKNFVPSYFGWMTMTEQKKRAKRLENLTDTSEKNKGEGVKY